MERGIGARSEIPQEDRHRDRHTDSRMALRDEMITVRDSTGKKVDTAIVKVPAGNAIYKVLERRSNEHSG